MSSDGMEDIQPEGPPPSYEHASGTNQPPQDVNNGEPIQKQPAGHKQSSEPRDHLSMLKEATGLIIEQKIHLLDVTTGWNSQCRFFVRDQKGDNIFYVKEVSNVCCRQCLRLANSLRLEFKDPEGEDVFVVERGVNCSSCCALFFPDTIRVSKANGELLGSVQELPHVFHPNYKVEDSVGNRVVRIQGPFCPMVCTLCRRDIKFKVKDWKESEIGTISKDWTNFPQEIFSNADNYSISFDADLEPSTKCLLLAALFLINYEFYEGCVEQSYFLGALIACLR